MNHPREKEHLLHKLAAASAFVCALCVLPVAQYMLTNSQLPATPEQGTVAGASTDSSITESNVPTPSAGLRCADVPQQQAALDAWLANYKAGVETQYTTQPAVKVQLATVAADPSQAEALQPVLAIERKPYDDRVSAAESAVDSQKKELASRSCLP